MRFVKRLTNSLSEVPRFEGKGLWNRTRFFLTAVLHLDGEASWLARSYAIGVFISLTPFYGLHTIMVLLTIPILRLNAAAALLGSTVNPPWVSPFIYGIGFMLGKGILGSLIPVTAPFPNNWAAIWLYFRSWEGFWSVIVPFFFGSMLVSIILGFLAYLASNWGISLLRCRNKDQTMFFDKVVVDSRVQANEKAIEPVLDSSRHSPDATIGTGILK